MRFQVFGRNDETKRTRAQRNGKPLVVTGNEISRPRKDIRSLSLSLRTPQIHRSFPLGFTFRTTCRCHVSREFALSANTRRRSRRAEFAVDATLLSIGRHFFPRCKRREFLRVVNRRRYLLSSVVGRHEDFQREMRTKSRVRQLPSVTSRETKLHRVDLFGRTFP